MHKSYSDYCNLSICGSKSLSFQSRQKRHSLYMNLKDFNPNDHISEPSTASSVVYSFGKDDNKNYHNWNSSQGISNRGGFGDFELTNSYYENEAGFLAVRISAQTQTENNQFMSNYQHCFATQSSEMIPSAQIMGSVETVSNRKTGFNSVIFSDNFVAEQLNVNKKKSSKTVAFLSCILASLTLYLYLICIMFVYGNLNEQVNNDTSLSAQNDVKTSTVMEDIG